jgi:hypothetical protein
MFFEKLPDTFNVSVVVVEFTSSFTDFAQNVNSFLSVNSHPRAIEADIELLRHEVLNDWQFDSFLNFHGRN